MSTHPASDTWPIRPRPCQVQSKEHGASLGTVTIEPLAIWSYAVLLSWQNSTWPQHIYIYIIIAIASKNTRGRQFQFAQRDCFDISHSSPFIATSNNPLVTAQHLGVAHVSKASGRLRPVTSSPLRGKRRTCSQFSEFDAHHHSRKRKEPGFPMLAEFCCFESKGLAHAIGLTMINPNPSRQPGMVSGLNFLLHPNAQNNSVSCEVMILCHMLNIVE